MKTIAIVGKVDSRIIVYPLARALSLAGGVSIITEDGSYKRLYFGRDTVGNVSGVDISVTDNLDTKSEESLDETGTRYDYRLVVSATKIPKTVNGIIQCMGIDRSIQSKDIPKEVDEDTIISYTKEDDIIDIPENMHVEKIYISFDKTPKNSNSSIRLRDTAIKYIYSCEECKELQILDDKSLNKLIAKIASAALGMSENDLFNLLTRKEFLKEGK